MAEESKNFPTDDEEHQRREQGKTELRQAKPQVQRERPPQDPLRDEEHQLATVQDGNGKQVQQRQVDRENRHERQEGDQALPGRLAGESTDRNRTADLRKR